MVNPHANLSKHMMNCGSYSSSSSSAALTVGLLLTSSSKPKHFHTVTCRLDYNTVRQRLGGWVLWIKNGVCLAWDGWRTAAVPTLWTWGTFPFTNEKHFTSVLECRASITSRWHPLVYKLTHIHSVVVDVDVQIEPPPDVFAPTHTYRDGWLGVVHAFVW